MRKVRSRDIGIGTELLCLQIDHGAPRNARHTSSFPAFVDEALGEDLGGCCGLYARQFPAVSFEMNTDASSAFRITQAHQQLNRLHGRQPIQHLDYVGRIKLADPRGIRLD
jgi:hypothetical protein